MEKVISVLRGDITKLDVDAIVNAANTSLAPGGGVDGAIRRAAGPEINDATARIGSCPTGKAVITEGFALPAKWVIHTAGPVWRGGQSNEAEMLASCYRNSLARAVEAGARKVAFPSISTGIYGFPPEEAALVAVQTIRSEIEKGLAIDKVFLVAFDEIGSEILSSAVDCDC